MVYRQDVTVVQGIGLGVKPFQGGARELNVGKTVLCAGLLLLDVAAAVVWVTVLCAYPHCCLSPLCG